MKSEPDVYGIATLELDRTTIWDGVRNYQARNFLKSMEVGDLARSEERRVGKEC